MFRGTIIVEENESPRRLTCVQYALDSSDEFGIICEKPAGLSTILKPKADNQADFPHPPALPKAGIIPPAQFSDHHFATLRLRRSALAPSLSKCVARTFALAALRDDCSPPPVTGFVFL